MRDDCRRVAVVGAKREVFRPQLFRTRDDHRAEAVEPNHRVEPRRNFRKQHDDALALLDAELGERSGIAPRRLGDRVEGDVVPHARRIDEQEPATALVAQRVDHIASEVEFRGHVPRESRSVHGSIYTARPLRFPGSDIYADNHHSGGHHAVSPCRFRRSPGSRRVQRRRRRDERPGAGQPDVEPGRNGRTELCAEPRGDGRSDGVAHRGAERCAKRRPERGCDGNRLARALLVRDCFDSRPFVD